LSELVIQQAAQDTLQDIEAFKNASIVINDWTILDGSAQNAPYVVIQSADEFRSRQDTTTPETNWNIILNVFVKFESYTKTYREFGLLRQAIVDEFNLVGGNRSAGSTSAVTADVIRNGSAILDIPDKNMTAQEQIGADPLFLAQQIILEVREF